PAGPAAPFPAEGNFLALIANALASAQLSKLGAIFVTATKLPVETEASPSLPALLGTESARTFDAAGLSVLRVTDTGSLRDPNHGKPGDTPDRIDYPRFLEGVRGIEAVLRNLLNPGPGGN
ncbi:MAG: putative aminopeptidase, partial [Verrucomicrobiales bacterium]|nr:putative aminopeptidase [Verrucomicrobiales bacterium]